MHVLNCYTPLPVWCHAAQYRWTRPNGDTSPYPESAALATFQMLYCLIWKFVLEQQKSERAGRTAMQSQLMGGDAQQAAGPRFLALGDAEDDTSRRLLELTESLDLIQAQVGEITTAEYGLCSCSLCKRSCRHVNMLAGQCAYHAAVRRSTAHAPPFNMLPFDCDSNLCIL